MTINTQNTVNTQIDQLMECASYTKASQEFGACLKRQAEALLRELNVSKLEPVLDIEGFEDCDALDDFLAAEGYASDFQGSTENLSRWEEHGLYDVDTRHTDRAMVKVKSEDYLIGTDGVESQYAPCGEAYGQGTYTLIPDTQKRRAAIVKRTSEPALTLAEVYRQAHKMGAVWAAKQEKAFARAYAADQRTLAAFLAFVK